MSWNNFNIPPTISEVAVDERLQQQQQQNGLNGGGMAGPNEESDDASTDTIRALQDSKLEPLMISASGRIIHWFEISGKNLQMLEQRDKLQEQVCC